jgi:hypothetical protein
MPVALIPNEISRPLIFKPMVLSAAGLKLSFAQEKEIRGEKEGKESLVGKVGIICY